MKTMLTHVAVTATVVLGLFWANPAIADDQTTVQKVSAFKGIVTGVNTAEKTISVKAFLSDKTFNVADTCRVTMEDKSEATLQDLHKGQKVEVVYSKEQGVMIAREITQRNVVFTGHIAAIDPDNRTLSVKDGGFTKDFTIGDDCQVVLKSEKSGSLADLKVGHTVNVIYESEVDSRTARKIEQKYDKFVGTVRAIDAETRTVKAKNFLNEKKFSLANDCRIVIDGRTDGRLSDLRIGDRVALSYEDSDGVLVASRIGLDEGAPEGESAQTTKASRTQH